MIDVILMTLSPLTIFVTSINACETSATLEEQRVALLGKKGKLTEALKTLGAPRPKNARRLAQHLIR